MANCKEYKVYTMILSWSELQEYVSSRSGKIHVVKDEILNRLLG